MSVPGFPHHAGKHAHDPVFTPAESVAGACDAGLTVPTGIVMTYQRWLIDELEDRGATRIDGYPGPWYSLWLLQRPGREPVGVAGRFGIGAPAAAMTLEELIALGARQVISMGTAGCLQPEVPLAATVLCDRALRDEGVSHHYVPGARWAEPDPGLTAVLGDALRARGALWGSGATWTIDAPFRETVDEARSYRTEGIVTVEMEASALFTVARLRGVTCASAFLISDHVLHDSPWHHDFHGDPIRNATRALLDTAVDVLGSTPP